LTIQERRSLVALLTIIAFWSSLANPHFWMRGAYDVYGFGPWWQTPGPVLDFAVLAIGATILWRGRAVRALRLLTLELLLYVMVTASSALVIDGGYFRNGWGGTFFGSLALAVASRAALLALASRWPPSVDAAAPQPAEAELWR
jgi:hypothetical protein